MSTYVDQFLTSVAMSLIAWIGRRMHPTRADWALALASEAEEMEAGWDKLRWAINGLPLVWALRRPPRSREAGIWSDTMDPRMAMATLNRRGADFVSVLVTTVLAGLVLFITVFLMPVYQAIMGQIGLAMPLPARLVIGAISDGYLFYGLLGALLAWLWLRRHTFNEPVHLRRILLTVNIVCVVALVSLTSGFLSFTLNIGKVFRASQQAALQRQEQSHVRVKQPAVAPVVKP